MRLILALLIMIMFTGLAAAQTPTTITLDPNIYEVRNGSYYVRGDINPCNGFDLIFGGASQFARCYSYYTDTEYTQELIDNVSEEYPEYFKTPEHLEYDPHIRISDFFGVCNYDDLGLKEIGKCSSNFITPSVNLGLLTMPFNVLYEDLKEFEVFGLVSFIYNFILALIRFALHFAFRFAIAYLIWVSLGFQILLNYVDRSKVLEHEEKVLYSFLVMFAATLYTMINGLGVAA